MRETKITDSSIARMAGNIAGSMMPHTVAAYGLSDDMVNRIAADCVRLARAIAAEVERTNESVQRTAVSG